MDSDTTFKGGCHCGAVRFQVRGLDLSGTITCNCSRCSMLGVILSFVPSDSFNLERGEDHLTDYQFNQKVIHHLFCDVCGIQSFSRANGPDGAPMVAVNVRCLDDIDLDAITPTRFDGKSK